MKESSISSWMMIVNGNYVINISFIRLTNTLKKKYAGYEDKLIALLKND